MHLLYDMQSDVFSMPELHYSVGSHTFRAHYKMLLFQISIAVVPKFLIRYKTAIYCDNN